MSDDILEELVSHLGIPGRRRWLRYAVHVGQKAPYVYVEVPKAACTTVKGVLREVEGKPPLENPMDIHVREKNGLPGLETATATNLAELFESHTWFTVVRHPLERLLSGYKSKILRSFKPDPRGEMRFHGVALFRKDVDAMAEHGFYEHGQIPTFEQFVRFVCIHQMDYERNIHWRHLHKCTWPNLIDYDHIVQAEDLETKFEPMVQTFAPGFIDAQGLLSTRKNSTANFDDEHDFTLSDEALEAFATAYEKDMRVFGYDIDAYGDPAKLTAATPRSAPVVIQPLATETTTRLLFANCPVHLDPAKHVQLSRTPSEHREQGPVNFGDALVCEATLRVVGETGPIENVGLDAALSDKRVEELRGNFDALVIRGSNYLTPFHDLGKWADAVEKLDLPVVLFGVGAQRPERKPFALQAGTERFLRMVAERGGPIGVRGIYTAELLERLGIPADPIGCPTIIRSGQPTISLERSERLRRWGLTINRSLKGQYAASNELLTRLQQQLARTAATDGRAIFLGQGEIAETVVALGDRDPEFIEAIAKGLGILTLPGIDGIIGEMVRSHLDSGEWTEEVAALDLVLGFRLHGNIIALTADTPTVFVSYDSRTAEMIELLDAPHVDITDVPNVHIDSLYADADFARTERRYAQLFKRWHEFIANRLPDRAGFFGTGMAPISGHWLMPAKTPNNVADNTSPHRAQLVDVSTRLDDTVLKLYAANQRWKAAEAKLAGEETPDQPTKTKTWGLTQ